MFWGRRERKRPGTGRPARTEVSLPPAVAGLSAPEARARHRRRTAAVVGLAVLGWLVFFGLTLDATVDELRLMRAPRYTAVVERDPAGSAGHPLYLHWVRSDGTDGYGTIEAADGYRLGRRVRVVEYTSAPCGRWTTAEDAEILPEVVALGLFGVPAAGILTYLYRRRLWWRRLSESAATRRAVGRVTGVRAYGRRQVLDVELAGRTVRVPLLGGQFVPDPESRDALVPLAPAERTSLLRGLWGDRVTWPKEADPHHFVPPPPSGRVLTFRVAGTDRVVWPSGPSRGHRVPYGALAMGALWICGPLLLALLLHVFAARAGAC